MGVSHIFSIYQNMHNCLLLPIKLIPQCNLIEIRISKKFSIDRKFLRNPNNLNEITLSDPEY